MKRQWRDVPGLEDRYEVSNDGLVRSKPLVLKQVKTKDGYWQVNIGGGTKYVHRLVAQAFLENTDSKRVVNHINGDRQDSRSINLEWTTHAENNAYTYRMGRQPPGQLPIVALAIDGSVAHRFASLRAASRYLCVTVASIRSAIDRKGTSCGYRWRYE